jgi:hypothetical protein
MGGIVVNAVATLWLVFPPGGGDQVWQTQPTASQVPAGSAICAWTIVNNDTNPNDYISNGQGGTTYSPPTPPTPAQNVPSADIARETLLADTNLSPTVLANLTPLLPLLDTYQYNPTLIQSVWTNWTTAYGTTWLNGTLQTYIQNDCLAANIQLIQQANTYTPTPEKQPAPKKPNFKPDYGVKR